MTRTEELEPVHRREDGELVGYLTAERRHGADVWVARALFGSELRAFPEREPAAAFLRRCGLSLLAGRWVYRPTDGGPDRPAALVEARLGEVSVRFGYDPAVTVLAGTGLDRLVPPAG
jgi:hypothetical protein